MVVSCTTNSRTLVRNGEKSQMKGLFEKAGVSEDALLFGQDRDVEPSGMKPYQSTAYEIQSARRKRRRDVSSTSCVVLSPSSHEEDYHTIAFRQHHGANNWRRRRWTGSSRGGKRWSSRTWRANRRGRSSTKRRSRLSLHETGRNTQSSKSSSRLTSRYAAGICKFSRIVFVSSIRRRVTLNNAHNRRSSSDEEQNPRAHFCSLS